MPSDCLPPSVPAAPSSRRARAAAGLWGRLGIYTLLLLASLVFLLPLAWMVATGLKTEGQTMKVPPEWIPRTFTATLTRRFAIDANGNRQPIPDPRPERIPVTRERRLAEAEALVELGCADGERPGKGLLEGVQLLLPLKDLKPLQGEWGAAVAPGPARARIRNAQMKREFQARVLRLFQAGMWKVQEYVPDARQATSASPKEQATYAWDVVPEGEILERVQPMWQNIPVSLNKMNFGRMLLNTLWVCLLGMVGTTFASSLAAYGFAFGTFRGKTTLFALTLATMMIPFPATMVPLFQLYRNLDWVGTFKPLWVHTWFGAAFNIFLLRQFFLGLPKDLLDSARIDGCGEFQIYWYVVLPLAKPALAMVALFHFLYAWKDFMGPLLYLTDRSQFTLSLGLQAFQSQQGGTPWHLVMAASAVFSLPLVVLFLLTMKTFLRGVATTGLKE